MFKKIIGLFSRKTKLIKIPENEKRKQVSIFTGKSKFARIDEYELSVYLNLSLQLIFSLFKDGMIPGTNIKVLCRTRGLHTPINNLYFFKNQIDEWHDKCVRYVDGCIIVTNFKTKKQIKYKFIPSEFRIMNFLIDPLINENEAVHYLGQSAGYNRLRHCARKGLIRSYLIDFDDEGYYWFKKSDLDKFAEKYTHELDAEIGTHQKLIDEARKEKNILHKTSTWFLGTMKVKRNGRLLFKRKTMEKTLRIEQQLAMSHIDKKPLTIDELTLINIGHSNK
jgi:hypothetical protein